MLKRLFIFFLVLVFTPFFICAQQSGSLRHEISVLNVEKGLPSRNVRTLVQDHKGMIWMATETGLCVYNGLDVLIYNHHPGSNLTLPSPVISDIAEDSQGRLWVCTDKGLCVMSEDRSHLWSNQTLGIPDSIHRKGNCFIEPHPAGGFWILAGTSLFRIQVDQLGVRYQKVGTSPFRACDRMMSSKKGELWLLSGSAIAIWEQNQFTQLDLQIKHGTAKFTLSEMYTEMINVLGDSITLMGTTTELFRLSLDRTKQNWVPEPFSQQLARAIPAYQCFLDYIKSLNNQQVWAGTQNGLSCLKVKTQQFFNFYENNGLPSNEFNTTAQLLAKNGLLYMGGIKGVAYIDPRQLNLQAPTEIRPYLELSVSNLNRHQSNTFYPEYGATVTLSSGLNYSSLRFFNSDASPAATACYYRYKIEGLFEEWRFAKSSERILLGHLKSGKYRLLLSIQIKGTWSKPYLLTLRVPTCWYRSWWFYSLCSLAFFGALYALYRLRVAQLSAQYQLRKQISDDLHDDLGTRIYALKSLAYQITQAGAKQYQLDELLTHFEKLSQETLLTIRNFIWAFDPKNDQLQDLIERMEKFVSTVIKPVVPNISFVTFSSSSSHKMLPGTKYHGLRLFQELLTNMVKHTFSQKITIDFQKDERFLLITVQNFYSSLRETDTQPEHYGQETMAHRIHEVGGQLSWEDEHNCQIATIRLPFA